YAIGLSTLFGFGTALALSSHGHQVEEEEEDVQNVLLATEPEPEPEPEAVEPEPVHVDPAPPQPRGPVVPTLTVPDEIPSDAPSEATPTADFNPYASGDPYQYPTHGRASKRAPVVAQARSPAPPAGRPSGAARATAQSWR